MVDENGYDWSALAKIAAPHKWLDMYSDYQDILQREDVAGWYASEFDMANKDGIELRKECQQKQEFIDALQRKLDRAILKSINTKNDKTMDVPGSGNY